MPRAHLGEFLKIDEAVSFCIHYRRFCPAAQVYLSDHFLFFGINGRNFRCIAVANKDSLGLRIVEHEIRILINRYRLQGLKAISVEHRDGRITAIGDKPAMQIRHNRGSVHTGRVFDVAEHLSRVCIQDVHLGTV